MKAPETELFLRLLQEKVQRCAEEELTRVIGSLEKIVERRVRRRLGKVMAKVAVFQTFGMPEIIINVSFKGGEEERAAI